MECNYVKGNSGVSSSFDPGDRNDRHAIYIVVVIPARS
jgi:hypothetical protein